MDSSILNRLAEITPEEQAILSGTRRVDRSIYMDGSRDVVTGDKLLDPGKQITIRPHTRFVAFPTHTHDYVELVYMCQGSTTHTVNGERIVLRAGEILMLGQNATQAIEPAGAEDLAVNFIVRPSFFSSVLPYLGEQQTPLHRFILSCLTGEAETGWLLFRAAEILPIQNLVENLLWTLMRDTPNKRGIHQLTVGLLFAELLNHTETLQFSSREQTLLITVLRYIEEHYSDGSLQQVADQTHYTLPALSRLIRQKTGKTYTELVQEKRMSQAAWLLRNTDRRVDEIARLVGYENVSYFHRLFASVFGQSPKHFRDCK